MQSISKLNKIVFLEWGLVLFGIVLRLIMFCSNPLPRPDCLVRYFVIQNYPCSRLIQFGHSIDILVHDPYGILLIQKLIISLFGSHEYVLRSFLLFCSLASIVLFKKIKNWFVGPYAGVAALGLLAMSGQLIRYTVILNTYESDVLVALLLFILFRKIFSASLDIRSVILYSLAGAFSIWFSLPAIFILGGISISLTIDSFLKKDRQRLVRLGLIALIWSLSFLFYYFYALKYFIGIPHVVDEWQAHMLPDPVNLTNIAGWFFKDFYSVFFNPLGVLPFIGIVLLSLGLVDIWRQEKIRFLFLASPLALVIMAAVFHKYPIAGRALIFLVPIFYLLLGQGWEFILRREGGHAYPVLTVMALTFLFYNPIISSYYNLKTRPQENAIVQIMEDIKKDFREGDIVYIHNPIGIYFRYYCPRFGFESHQYIIGTYCGKLECGPDLEKLKGYKRVWYVSDLRLGAEMTYVLTALNRIGRLVLLDAHKFRCYLYEINPLPDG